MIKVAVISNSHAGALKNAINDISTKNYKFVFFARPGGFGGIQQLVIENGVLDSNDNSLKAWWKKTCGLDSINLTEYDMFWYHGINIDPQKFYPILKSNMKFYSKQLKEKYHHDLRIAIPSLNLYNNNTLKLLYENTNKPIIVSNRAFWSMATTIKDSFLSADYKNIESFINIRDIVTESSREIYEQFNAIFIPQPEITLDGIFTKEEYCQEDGKHMNALYGGLVLKDFFYTVSG